MAAYAQVAMKEAANKNNGVYDVDEPLRYWADLEQWPSVIHAGSSEMLPCLTRGSLIWSFGQKRPLTGAELVAFQGMPLPIHLHHGSTDIPWDAHALSQLHHRSLCHAAGNGLHAHVFAAFFAFCVGNVSLVEASIPVWPDAQLIDSDSDTEVC